MILVLGGLGFLGSHICDQLQAIDAPFHVVDTGEMAKLESPRHAATVTYLDTRELDRSVFRGCDVVIDLAALSSDAACSAEPDACQAVNVDARSRNIGLAVAEGVRRYVLASTTNVYAFGAEVVDESTAPAPDTLYAKSLHAAEHAVLRHRPSVEVIVLRQATLFGMSNALRLDLAVNAIAYAAATGDYIRMAGDGTQVRPFLHVRESATAFVRASLRPLGRNQTLLNLGRNDCHERVRSLIEAALAAAQRGPDSVTTYGTADKSQFVDFARADRSGLLDATHVTPLEGIASMVERFRDRPLPADQVQGFRRANGAGYGTAGGAATAATVADPAAGLGVDSR